MLKLKGDLDVYSFEPSDKERVLRASGKFGSTYIGRNSSGTDVVVKKLNPKLNKDPEAIARFKREGEIHVEHPGLVHVFEYMMHGEDHYLVREYSPGTDLKTLSLSKKLSAKAYVEIAIKVCDALGALHAKNIIHRDVRPANIIVGDTHGLYVKLIDLGLAKLPGDGPDEKGPFSLIYSPPEQVINCAEAVNASSDVYSLAVSIYECMSRSIPFYHENPEMMMHLQIGKSLLPDRRIPPALFAVLQKASSKHCFSVPPNKYKKEELLALMLKGQEERYATAHAFSAALRAILPTLEERNFFQRLFSK